MGTRASVGFGGSLGLEMSLHLFGVLGRSGLSVMGGHLGVVVRCAYIVSGFMRVKMVGACGNVAIEKRGPLEAIGCRAVGPSAPLLVDYVISCT